MRVLKISALLLACSAGALALAPARAEMDEHMGYGARFEKMCSEQGQTDKFTEMQTRRAAHLAEYLKLSDAQKAAFKDLQEVRAKAHADATAALCANKPDFSSFEKKMAFLESMMQRHLDTFKAAEPKLIAFYNGLDPWQKTEFEKIMHHMMERGWEHRGGGMMDHGMMDHGMMDHGMMGPHHHHHDEGDDEE